MGNPVGGLAHGQRWTAGLVDYAGPGRTERQPTAVAREPDHLHRRRIALGSQLAAARQAVDRSQAWLAARTHYDRSTISHLEAGDHGALSEFWRRADTLLRAGGSLIRVHRDLEAVLSQHEAEQHRTALEPNQAEGSALTETFHPLPSTVVGPVSRPVLAYDDEQDALELARRVAASDVGTETLARLEQAVDDLATSYPVTPPTALIGRLRRQLAYVGTLLDARKTLDEQRRLLVVGGWLSLLAATVHIDLDQGEAATARLRTAAGLARHAEHDEIRAWCYETDAWRALTDGDHPRALTLSHAAQHLAPKGSSIAIQAIAQEGRARARLGQARETYDAIGRVQKLVSPLPRPDRPEHHYQYDPTKAVAYTATTLAWVGDPVAEAMRARLLTGSSRSKMSASGRAGSRPPTSTSPWRCS